MHFDMSAEPARGRRCAEMRKSLHFATVSGCALEPPSIRNDIQAVRHAGIATILDLPSIAPTIVACPHRIIPFPELPTGEDDYLDFYRAPSPRKLSARQAKSKWQPKIVDDWPDEVPVFSRSLSSSNCISAMNWTGFSASRSDSNRGGLA